MGVCVCVRVHLVSNGQRIAICNVAFAHAEVIYQFMAQRLTHFRELINKYSEQFVSRMYQICVRAEGVCLESNQPAALVLILGKYIY